MLSPIAIPHRSASPSSSSSASSWVSSAPTTPTSARYVPLHKRSGSSSRASSPTSPSFPVLAPKPHPLIYSANLLLSLRPYADESAKQRMRDLCPEVVMNRRTRKNLEWSALHGHQHQVQPAHIPEPITYSAPVDIQVTAPAATSSQPARTMPRRNRSAVRAPERRRQALQTSLNMTDSWRTRVPATAPLAVV